MSVFMWFLLGMLCGAGVAALVGRTKAKSGGLGEKTHMAAQTPSRKWVETRNFLYYDGTVMPEIKEDLNEQ